MKKSSKTASEDPKMEQWRKFFTFHDKDGSGTLASHEFKVRRLSWREVHAECVPPGTPRGPD
jgi:hypothetical protein